ncbi:recombinase family protein [Sphingomonas panacisoli]|uniref:Recombinase family protein n=1 Tax=Sphingomonas panacisoli TaxID=1813879 RepID=A0A5B8LK41_9SPHN|nr:recombinase family protein [Sphingomonas panacisoli]QDZ08376.1 recombinase family protein [Sphingomonas panacisoli]
MTRVAIYARFSTDKQSEKSAEDQARLCKSRADREGWDVIGVYPDLALSGTTRDRPGLNVLLAQLDRFDVVLAESIDRISRDQEDIAAIYKQLRFAGVQLITLSEGEVGEIHVGLNGTMAALFLRQLGEKTRRGQLGRVAIGRIPGGLSYGYALIPAIDAQGRPDRGQRAIDQEQANVVRRIFAE